VSAEIWILQKLLSSIEVETTSVLERKTDLKEREREKG
jgi:hypothetical protein